MVRKWDILKGDNTGANSGKLEAGGRGGGENAPLPPSYFCRSVYPISTGQIMLTNYYTSLQIFKPFDYPGE